MVKKKRTKVVDCDARSLARSNLARCGLLLVSGWTYRRCLASLPEFERLSPVRAHPRRHMDNLPFSSITKQCAVPRKSAAARWLARWLARSLVQEPARRIGRSLLPSPLLSPFRRPGDGGAASFNRRTPEEKVAAARTLRALLSPEKDARKS